MKTFFFEGELFPLTRSLPYSDCYRTSEVVQLWAAPTADSVLCAGLLRRSDACWSWSGAVLRSWSGAWRGSPPPTDCPVRLSVRLPGD